MNDFFMTLPRFIDLTPTGEIVKKTDFSQPGYAENIECSLQISLTADGIELSYYCEDDTVLDMDQFHSVIKLANNKD